MLLKFGTPCRSRAERLGSLHGLSVEPNEKLLLRVIVEEPQAEPLSRVKVPFGKVDQSDADQVVLALSPAELKAMGAHDADAKGGRKRTGGRRRRGDEPVERVLTARTKIQCRDGEVGSLSTVTVDSRTGDLESFSFPFGVPVTRELQVGADQIAEIGDDRIVLKIDMDDLAGFPSLRS